MPVAIRNPVVLHCVLALTAADLSKFENLDSDLMSISYNHYGQALKGIQSALKYEVNSASTTSHLNYIDDILLAVLLLCFKSQNFTQNERIVPHINAAAVLCCNRLESATNNPDMRGLLFEVFCYMFTLVASSHGKALELSLAYQVFYSPFLTGHACEGMLLGTSRKLFLLILRISMLTTSQDSVPLDASSRFELEAIELQLSNLKFNKPTDRNDDEEAYDHATISELYRHACLLHVKTTLNHQLSIKSDIIQNIVTDFVSQLEELPISSPANNILVWPLVIVGLCTITQCHQRIISARLRKNHETWRSEILPQNAAFLIRTWKPYRNPSKHWRSRNEVPYLARRLLNLQIPAILL
ncbi:hypothetical protein B7463_g2496, partial [Scytalidium lignicola]